MPYLETKGRDKMNLTVHFEKKNSIEKIQWLGNTVRDLLKHLKINPETVLVARNDEVLTEDEILQDNDTIEILNVISGG